MDGKEGLRLHAVYAMATSTKEKHDRSPDTAPHFIYKPAKEGYCRNVLSAVGLRRLVYNFDRNDVLTPTAPLDDANKKWFLRHDKHVFHTTRINDCCQSSK